MHREMTRKGCFWLGNILLLVGNKREDGFLRGLGKSALGIPPDILWGRPETHVFPPDFLSRFLNSRSSRRDALFSLFGSPKEFKRATSPFAGFCSPPPPPPILCRVGCQPHHVPPRFPGIALSGSLQDVRRCWLVTFINHAHTAGLIHTSSSLSSEMGEEVYGGD